MILINNINLPLDTDFNGLNQLVAKKFKLDINNIKSVKLYRKSVDARHKNDVHFCCSFLVELCSGEEKFLKLYKNAQSYKPLQYEFKKAENILENPPVVVGFGPAGMFAALTLAKAGLCPIVIERGMDVDNRKKAVDSFFSGKSLNPNTNVQFGEGGAGTFSDGKLNTGIKDKRCKIVLFELNKFGAGDNILTDAKPHIGTDVLINVVKNLREEVIKLGGRVLFETELRDIIINNGKITSIETNKGSFDTDILILATGHSARDTFLMLKSKGIKLEQKPFAVGVRIEHLSKDINRALYGDFADSEHLGAADYKLVAHLESGRGVYTFCMCPGGEVINASSEENGVAVNGMSYSRRDGENSNSALLVGVNTEDFGSSDVLAGCYLQQKIEQNAFNIGNGKVPITSVGNFVNGEEFKIGKVKPTVKPDTVFADFYKIFPQFVCDSLKEAIPIFDKKINGFADREALLIAPETRSSSPVRITRNENFESVNTMGLFPCGEGAGYAGGIMSAAVDGMKIAEQIIENINLKKY
ncbi:MAG: hypothetical protein IJP34_02340 [Clostridia bacterium]|nr:hypothetical protein [Clostridia bacterium]